MTARHKGGGGLGRCEGRALPGLLSESAWEQQRGRRGRRARRPCSPSGAQRVGNGRPKARTHAPGGGQLVAPGAAARPAWEGRAALVMGQP